MIPYNQLSLADIFSDCQEIYESDKPAFLSLLQEHIDLDEIVPASFRRHFYAPAGRTRLYPLNAFCGRSLSSAFSLYPQTPFFWSSFIIPGIAGNSAALERYQTLPRPPASNRISWKISRTFLKSLLALRNPSAMPLTFPKQA